MATINPNNLKDKITEAIIRSLEAQQRVVFIGMNNLRADLLERIFDSGIASDGSKIGSYSTKPIYVSKASSSSQVRSSSLKPKGKNSNDSKFANGKERRSQYFPGGYKEYRGTVGRQSDKVDLRLTGSLQLSIQLGQSDNGQTLAFNNDDQLRKASGNERRFGKVIFDPSKEEIDTLTNLWEKEVTEAFFKAFDE